MKITVLNDNAAGRCPGEHGLSFIVKADKRILFDVGPSEIFQKNAATLGTSLEGIDIVLSHGHLDHGGGLKFIEDKKLICHPDCFTRRYRKKDDLYVGLPLTLGEAMKKFKLILTKNPYKISDKITFLGEIPRENDFESKATAYYKKGGDDDFLLDDSALAIKTTKGLVVVVGCSHSGVCNIVEYAKKVTGLKKVYAVIGGFHLLALDERVHKTIEYFKREKIEKIHPSHCVDDSVIKIFSEEFNSKMTHSGDVIEL